VAALKTVSRATHLLPRSIWPYLASAVVGFAAASLLLVGGKGSNCADNTAELAARLNRLESAYVGVYQRDAAEIEACQSLACEQPAKTDIAAALRSYNDGLSSICWPGRDAAAIDSLSGSNASLAAAYLAWSEAFTPAEDQTLEDAAQRARDRRDQAYRAASGAIRP
jgi:hypothetical protein